MPDLVIQDYVFYALPMQLISSFELPLFLVFFLFFVTSLLHPFYLKKLKPQQFSWHTSSLLFFICLAIEVLVILGQFFGGYQASFNVLFWQLICLFGVYPAAFIFLQQRKEDLHKITQIKNTLYGFVTAAGCSEGILALLQFLRSSNLGLLIEKNFTYASVITPEMGIFRSPGTLGHPNFLGAFLSMILPIILFLFLQKKGRFFFISLLITLAGLLLSMSRWAWISGALSSGIFLFFAQERMKKRYSLQGLFFTGTSVLAILLFIVFPRFSLFETYHGRIEVAQAYLQVIQQHFWWGAGPGQGSSQLHPYRYNFAVYENSLKSAHNTLLLVAGDTGVPIAFLLILCFFLVGVRTFQLLHLKQWSEELSFFLAMCVFVLNTLLYPLFC